jgi:hypothetical protein
MMARRCISDRQRYLLGLVLVIMTGIGSRLIHTGLLMVDKYLGDALYAVMIYLLLALWRQATPPLRRAIVVMAIMTVIETFQLTGIPLTLTQSSHFPVRLCGRLLGTTFSWLDLAAYLVGIVAVLVADYRWFNTRERIQ